jgi:Zn-finger nucleic acid-binding protein
MNCPRCLASSLLERNREGVTIDVCEACRGIWLDRGELEKLIARARREEPAQHDDDHDHDDVLDFGDRTSAAREGSYNRVPVRANRPPRDDDSAAGRPPGPPRKRRWYESLGDLFD